MAFSKRGTPSHEVERVLRTIFKRCVQCGPGTPSCPDCADGEICSLVPQDCNSCAHATCIANPSAVPKSSGPNVGAIAGGVVAGIFTVSLAVFLLWFFWIRKRRLQQELEADLWEGEGDPAQHKFRKFSQMHADAASTRTRASLANSILSRASNIIQIAYIPGITNRNGSGRNTPVPPIPAAFRSGAQTPKTPLTGGNDALFFRPSDLRDSSYSGTSSFVSAKSRQGNRDTQYTRHSITPSLARSSVASEIFRNDATIDPMPATQVTRALPRVVSVKSSKSGGSSSEISSGVTPPMPQGAQVVMPGAGVVQAKAIPVTVGGTKSNKGPSPDRREGGHTTSPGPPDIVPTVSSPLIETLRKEEHDSISSTDDEVEEEHARARKSLIAANSPEVVTQQPSDSPFRDELEALPRYQPSPRVNPYASMGSSINTSSEDRLRRGHRPLGGLSAVIEEASKNNSRPSSYGSTNPPGTSYLPQDDTGSPFHDQYATE